MEVQLCLVPYGTQARQTLWDVGRAGCLRGGCPLREIPADCLTDALFLLCAPGVGICTPELLWVMLGVSRVALGFPLARHCHHHQRVPKQALEPAEACSLSGQIVIHDTFDPLLLEANVL